jgi:tRNA(Arg) A34 adenosine deaminase TadA
MPVKLKPEFDNFKKSFPSENIAGFIDVKGAFQWCRRKSTGNLPAAAYVADYLTASGNSLRKVNIYTSLKSDHWIRTYFSDSILSLDEIKETTVQSFDRTSPRTDFKLKLFSDFEQFDAPFPGGGLYDAATADLSLTTAAQAKLTGERKGRIRALRYYMLAAYSLLGLCKFGGYTGGNYVATIMVSDEGQILSYGVNNGQSAGSFHHAEVNMLLDYFRRNPTAKQFPEKTIVFSTLTPCEQCTRYLKDARPKNCLIYFGQLDTGKQGRAGTAISKAFDVVTKPVRGSQVNSGAVNKWQISTGLSSCMGAGRAIATQIGDEDPAAYLQTAQNALYAKVNKERGSDDPTTDAEEQVKGSVLKYLLFWTASIGQRELGLKW